MRCISHRIFQAVVCINIHYNYIANILKLFIQYRRKFFKMAIHHKPHVQMFLTSLSLLHDYMHLSHMCNFFSSFESVESREDLNSCKGRDVQTFDWQCSICAHKQITVLSKFVSHQFGPEPRPKCRVFAAGSEWDGHWFLDLLISPFPAASWGSLLLPETCFSRSPPSSIHATCSVMPASDSSFGGFYFFSFFFSLLVTSLPSVCVWFSHFYVSAHAPKHNPHVLSPIRAYVQHHSCARCRHR